MSNISNIIVEYSEDVEAVSGFCEEMYQSKFSQYLDPVRHLYVRLKSEVHPITDEELEYILTELPMDLFMVSENLNALRLECEVTKLKNKETREQLQKSAEATCEDTMKKTERAEFVSRQVAYKMAEYEIVLVAYNSVIARVENELSFARELIMGAKKIWDSRRHGEESNPVGPVDTNSELPEYQREYQRNQYIK